MQAKERLIELLSQSSSTAADLAEKLAVPRHFVPAMISRARREGWRVLGEKHPRQCTRYRLACPYQVPGYSFARRAPGWMAPDLATRDAVILLTKYIGQGGAERGLSLYFLKKLGLREKKLAA